MFYHGQTVVRKRENLTSLWRRDCERLGKDESGVFEVVIANKYGLVLAGLNRVYAVKSFDLVTVEVDLDKFM